MFACFYENRYAIDLGDSLFMFADDAICLYIYIWSFFNVGLGYGEVVNGIGD